MGLAADGSWFKQAQDEGAFLARAGRASSTWGGGPGGGRQGQGVAGSGQNIPCKLTQQPLARTCLSATLRRGGREEGGPAQPPCLGPREPVHLAWLAPPTHGRDPGFQVGVGRWGGGGAMPQRGALRPPSPQAAPRLSSSWPLPPLGSTGSPEAQFLQPGAPPLCPKEPATPLLT